MNSSRYIKESPIISIYKDSRTVFRLKDVALLVGDSNFQSLNKKVNYYVRTGKLLNPRKGIYAKPGFNPEELACLVYTPSYISLEYVLQRSGVIFQYGSVITSISYLSRRIEVDDMAYQYRKIKGDILANLKGINRQDNYVNIASAERAFMDVMYLDPNYYFDNLSPLNKNEVFKLINIYNSKSLSERVKKKLQDD